HRVQLNGPRECLELGMQLESLRIHSRAMMSDVLSSAERLLSSVEGLGGQTENIATRSQRQTQSVGQVAAALEELTTAVYEISAAAQQSAEYADHSQLRVSEGQEAMKASHASTTAVIDSVEHARIIVTNLQSTSSRIGTVAALIEDVAGQTNLLALNAAIEAAHAGEQGKGFAVVADEVRKLAERTAQSVGDIRILTQDIHQRTGDATQAIGFAVKQVLAAGEQMQHSHASLHSINQESQSVVDAAQEIALMVEQQSISAAEIASNMETVNSMSEQNVFSVGQVHNATCQLRETALAMRALVGHFEKSL
ncbi:MAG: hypothetical protein RI925_2318, partial [Pseudomonadota bacterium]